MYAIIDTKTLRAICDEVKTVKETGKLPEWMYNGICWLDSYEQQILTGAIIACWYEFCLQSMESAKPVEDWHRVLRTVDGCFAVDCLLEAGLLARSHVHSDLTTRHSRSITRRKSFRTVLQPQTGRRYEDKTKEGFSGLTVQQVISILKAVGVHWDSQYWNKWKEWAEGE